MKHHVLASLAFAALTSATVVQRAQPDPCTTAITFPTETIIFEGDGNHKPVCGWAGSDSDEVTCTCVVCDTCNNGGPSTTTVTLPGDGGHAQPTHHPVPDHDGGSDKQPPPNNDGGDNKQPPPNNGGGNGKQPPPNNDGGGDKQPPPDQGTPDNGGDHKQPPPDQGAPDNGSSGKQPPPNQDAPPADGGSDSGSTGSTGSDGSPGPGGDVGADTTVVTVPTQTGDEPVQITGAASGIRSDLSVAGGLLFAIMAFAL